MEEIIATRMKYAVKGPKYTIAGGVFIIFLCVLALILYPIVGWRFTFLKDFEAWQLVFFAVGGFVLGGVMIAVSAFMLYRANRTPEAIIKYRDGILYFAGGFSCRIEEVESVRCSSYGNIVDVVHDYAPQNTLTVVVGGKEMVFKMIEDVKYANDRLIELMLESRERSSVKLDYRKR